MPAALAALAVVAVMALRAPLGSVCGGSVCRGAVVRWCGGAVVRWCGDSVCGGGADPRAVPDAIILQLRRVRNYSTCARRVTKSDGSGFTPHSSGFLKVPMV
ncbi:hypothetical protein GCM10009839_55400 [Catenulispora yoronensis]|uniref:Secreted protein n=1 Tax=Catenulispora yoronensis TaxID=450799 RepID=A0ABN2UX25_9ACTN